MEIIKAQTTDLVKIQEIPQEAKVGKFPLEPYLHNDLVQRLPEITKAEISQSMLKWSNDEEVSVFTARVLNFINPKFNDEHEIQLAEAELYSFAKKCELTANEFLLALDLASDGKLFSEPDENGNARKVQLFREIDRLKLGEVKSAFIYYKTIDKQHERGKSEIKAFLEPPKPEPTPEEIKQSFLQMCRTEYGRLKKEGSVLATPIFWNYIKNLGIENVRISWVLNILERFQPETFQSGLSTSKAGSMLDMPKKTKHNAKVFFIDNLVKAYFEKENLKELSEDGFVEYWENIFEKTQNLENG